MHPFQKKHAKRPPLPTARQTAVTLIVAALGYLVDIYDLVLFSVIRTSSLKGLGVEGEGLMTQGVLLINMQMLGLLLGGVLWGILGDKKGRLSVLLGSILLYSGANIANAFVTSVGQYAVLRFIAGVGLAGELGAAITLIAEMLPKEKRGYGTTFVATIGVSGALLAATVGSVLPWRTSYLVGGVLGLLLLFLRVGVLESTLFESLEQTKRPRGSLRLLFAKSERSWRFVYCILVGIPIWYVIGILATFAPEITTELRVFGTVSSAEGIFYTYLGFVFGDLSSGVLSQALQSRVRAVQVFLLLLSVFYGAFLWIPGWSAGMVHWLYVGMGFAGGYWAVLMVLTSEQFGTNLRATVTTSVPNLIRGSLVLLTFAMGILKNSFGFLAALKVLGLLSLLVAFFAIGRLRESFGKSLDFLE